MSATLPARALCSWLCQQDCSRAGQHPLSASPVNILPWGQMQLCFLLTSW